MKRLIAMLCVAGFAVALIAGCSDGGASDSDTSTPPPAPASGDAASDGSTSK